MPEAVFDRDRIRELAERETRRFKEERPRSMALLQRGRSSMPAGVPLSWMSYFYPAGPTVVDRASGTYFTDIDGHRYLDMNLADTSMATGYAIEAVADVVDRQFRKGSQMLLPIEESVEVAEELASRFGLAAWQITLSASNANTEAMRIARAWTGRDKVLLFDGKYHGMLDETLHYLEGGRLRHESVGLPRGASHGTIIVQYNDLDAVEEALSQRQVACVLAEPAVTNVGGVIVPDDGFLEGLRQLTTRYGTLLVLDEAHTHVCAYGGLTRAWGLQTDILVLGKAIGGGIPVGVYGMTEELREFLDFGKADGLDSWHDRVALGGTCYANPLQVVAMKATLGTVLTEQNHERVNTLGERLAAGIDSIIENLALPWCTYRLYCRSGYHAATTLPRNNLQMTAAHDSELRDAMHVWLANRGIWEAINSASPAVSFSATETDVDFYLTRLGECLADLLG